MSAKSRKWIGRAIQLALVVVAIAFVAYWVRDHVLNLGHHGTHVAALAVVPDSLGPGDLRIYNTDSTLDVVLMGDRIAAGLAPRMIEQVRLKLDSSKHADSGLGGSIASMVKKSVAGAIGTHAMYALADIRDIRYDNGHLILLWKSGGSQTMFKGTHINMDDKQTNDDRFSKADAQRFIAAVHARQKELGGS